MSACWLRAFCFAVICAIASKPSQGAEIAAVSKQLIAGRYEAVIEAAEKPAKEERDEQWPNLLIRAQMAVGKYPEALASTTNALRRFSTSIRLRLLAHEVFQMNGRAVAAEEVIEEINDLHGSRSWAYRDPENVVALGSAAVLMGADPKLVLDNFFEPAKKVAPKLRDSYLAAGQLALEKQDYGLAGKYFAQGLKEHPDDPDMHFGMARAFAPDNRQEMVKSIERAFNQNARHVPAMLLLVDHLIDSEAYSEAEEKLKKAEETNPDHPEIWAFRAVIAHVNSQPDLEEAAQQKALKLNPMNPRVAHLIGLKLSQKYRFQEGSEFQRKATAWDGKYLPAKFQLAQDLLRLGEESEGWALAEAVHKADAYNVGAYNLVTLKDTLSKFETFTNEHFTIRMSEHERAIYGDDVMGLLTRAQRTLCGKYKSTLSGPTVVEIFPEQKDFAIRTFGMPGGEGYLGVCFGRVITANSPASQAAHPANWQAMLWHEFCHVVTLQLTRNRMPRWLSEGISVYEERVANPTWGQSMNPRYRELIMKGELKAIDDLSAAFMAPEDDLHLQFAYYQSYLVVEHIVQKYGQQAIEKILHDLGDGVLINDAIARHTTKLAELDKDFKAYAKAVAEAMAPSLDWSKPKFLVTGDLDPAWALSHPNNFWRLDDQATELIEEKKWMEAKIPLQKVADAYPEQTGAGSAAHRLARIHRSLNETEEELAVLRKLAARDAEALDVYLRLMELDAAREDWKNTLENAERARAVNPLTLPANQRHFVALQKLGRVDEAIVAGEKLLRLNPPDPTEVHYELAKLLSGGQAGRARLHAIQALEEAPRFREAQKLLLKLAGKSSDAERAVAVP